MNVQITGRHLSLSEDQKAYARKKINKLEKYFNQILDAHVVMHVEKLDHTADVTVNGDGVQFHGREKGGDFFSAIDLLFEKMEKQIVRWKERHQMHKGPEKEGVSLEVPGGEGEAISMTQVSNKPTDQAEAYLQMKMRGSDFILFKKGSKEVDSADEFANKNYAVIYKDGAAFRMVEIPSEHLKAHSYTRDMFAEYDFIVVDDSPSHPRIELKKRPACSIRELSLQDALAEIAKNGSPYLPFFNLDSQFFNVIYTNGRSYGVMVPAF